MKAFNFLFKYSSEYRELKTAFKKATGMSFNDTSVIFRRRKVKPRYDGLVKGKCFTSYHDGLHSLYVANGDVFHSMLGVVDDNGTEYVAKMLRR